MKNASDHLNDLWPSVRECGTAALLPNFARRVLERAAAAREEFTPRMAWTLFFGTAIACFALTLVINHWNTNRTSDNVIAQWSEFGLSDNNTDQGV